MSNLIRAVFLLGFLLFASTAAADSKTEIKAVLDYFAEMWNEGELNAIKGYYHRDFVLVTPDGIHSMGRRLDDLEVIMEEGKDHGELSFSEVQVKPLGEEHAIAFGRSRLKFGDGTELNDFFSTVYVKTPFGWKAILSHD